MGLGKEKIPTIDLGSYREEDFTSIDAMAFQIQKDAEEALSNIDRRLWVIPYLCPFCVGLQDEVTGDCHCDCHEDKHLKEYYKQLTEDQ